MSDPWPTTVLEIAFAGGITLRRGERRVGDRAFAGRQLRLVTAMLVLDRADPITVDAMATELWPDGLPDQWRVAVRGLVAKVRRRLADVGAEAATIRGEQGRYWVDLGEVAVDLESAGADLARARARMGAGEFDDARVHASRARAVVSRPLLSGVSSAWVERLRDRVALQHIEALQLLGTCRSELGRHAQARAVLSEALDLDVLREDTWRALMQAEVVAGNGAEALQAYERCRQVLAEELGVDPSPATQQLHADVLTSIPSQAASATTPVMRPAPHPPGEDVAPFVGLRAFVEDDATWFFGRDAETQELLDRLARRGIAVVVGPSGVGKSSLVRAGLLPALARGAIPESDTWVPVVTAPGSEPIKALVAELSAVGHGLSPAAVAHLVAEEGDDGIHEVAARVLDEDRSHRLVVVVDQLEELFTLGGEAEAEPLVRSLVAAATRLDSRVAVVVALRADFVDRAAEVGPLAELLSNAQFVVPPMEAEGIEQAVAGPARAAGVRLEDGLLARILTDVAGQPGSLPLLQHLLWELWHQRTDRVLTRWTYEGLGGVAGALARRAEAVFTAMDTEDARTARRVLLRGIHPGRDTGDARRPVPAAELMPADGDPARVAAVVDRLVEARLLSASHDETSGERTVELSHEALIDGWPRLRAWVDQARGWLLDHRRLTAAATEWERHGRHDDWLLTGAQLDQAHDLLLADGRGEVDLPLSPTEHDLVRASLDARRAAEAAEAARRTRERALEARSRRRLRTLVAVMTVAALVTGGLTVMSVRQSERLAAQARAETARRLATEALASLDVDADRSILLALAAVESTREVDGTVLPEAESALRRAVSASRLVLSVPQGGVDGVAFNSTGTAFVTAGEGTATTWDAGDGERLLTLEGHDGHVLAAAFSPDDRLIATSGADGTVRLWDASTGEPMQILDGHDGPAAGIAFSSDGELLASGGEDGLVRLWQVDPGARVRRLLGHKDTTLGVAFSPDGTRLVSGSLDSTARIWDVETGRTVHVLDGHEWPVEAAFSPDGTRVTTASAGSARVWDAATGEVIVRFFGERPFEDVAYSPDGRRLATVSRGGPTQVWDAGTGEELLSLPGHAPSTLSVAFAPDGEQVLTAGADGVTRLWDLSVGGARDWLTVPGAQRIHVDVAFSPDGTRFAAPAEPAGVTIWEAETGEEIITLPSSDPTCHTEPIPPCRLTRVVFSPDGQRLAAGSDHQGSPPVWDVATGDLLFQLEALAEAGRTPGGAGVRHIAFSPDGTRIATGAHDGTVAVWDAATGELVTDTDVDENLGPAVAYTPDGESLVTGHIDGTIRMWDAETLEPLSTVQAHDGKVTDVDFGPDDRMATASWDGTAKLWQRGTDDPLRAFRGHDTTVWNVAFTPEGAIATTGQDGTARLWDPTTGQATLTLQDPGTGGMFGVGVSPDGRLLATASPPDGRIALHLLPLDDFLEVARSRLTRGLTDAECRRYLPREECA